MKYSYNWLKKLSGTKKSSEKVAEDLTMHCFEIDKIEKNKDDAVLDIKVLPDRSHDCLSHVGMAREIAVLEEKKIDYDFDGLKLSSVKTRYSVSPRLRIKIEDKKLCPRYLAAIMKDVKVKESPLWLKNELQNCGINSINNVVDATNYVMLEIGQPLHAFDFNKLASRERTESDSVRMVVRRAKDKEKIELLDGVVKELTSDDLLITNGETPLAIAGIKGGKVAEVTSKTETLILEAANFNSTAIRKTRVRLGIRTEASDRFEKDIDPNLAEKALVRVAEILEKIAGGKMAEVADVYPNPIKPWKIRLGLDYVSGLLGENIPVKDAVRILRLLEVDVKMPGSKSASLECVISTFRLDLKTPEDLIEEIGRIWGYEKIKPQPLTGKVIPAVQNKTVFFERKIKENLAGLGFDEMYNYSFYSEKDVNGCGLGEIKHLELANPQNPDQKYVRASLIPNIIKNVYENLKNFQEFRLFEIGRVYFPTDGFPKEKRMLAMAQILEEDRASDTFLILKGAMEDLLESFGMNKNLVSVAEPKSPEGFWHPVRSAEIKINSHTKDLFACQLDSRPEYFGVGVKESVGHIGEINPAILKNYRIKKKIAVAEIDLENLRKVTEKEEITYQPIRKFPIVSRDISLLAGRNLTVAEISEQIKKSGGDLVIAIELFDIFEKNNETSLAFHIDFGAENKTLESREADEAMKKIISDLERKLKVEVRM